MCNVCNGGFLSFQWDSSQLRETQLIANYYRETERERERVNGGKRYRKCASLFLQCGWIKHTERQQKWTEWAFTPGRNMLSGYLSQIRKKMHVDTRCKHEQHSSQSPTNWRVTELSGIFLLEKICKKWMNSVHQAGRKQVAKYHCGGSALLQHIC